jgi:Tol biopolymer transport system component
MRLEAARMLKKYFIVICALSLAACSIKVASNSEDATPLPMNTPVPIVPTKPAWTRLNLRGHLVYIQALRTIVKLDLASGQSTQLWQAPNNAWITAASVSPNGKQIVLAYSPPVTNTAQVGYSDLYIMPADGSSAPKVFMQHQGDQESFSNPVWAADSQSIYYSHEVVDTTSHQKYVVYKYVLERATYPVAQPQKLLDASFWPRLSADGSKLVYVSYNPVAFANDLYTANADGSSPKLVLPAGDFFAVDAPLFSPDGQTLLFSAVGQPQVAQLSWFDQLMGVQVAEAHNVPSEWWSVPAAGGKPKQLTNIADTSMYGAFSADGKHFAFVSANGLFVMNPDGSNLMQLAPGGPTGTVDWIP